MSEHEKNNRQRWNTKVKMMAWNINGWKGKGEEKIKNKMNRVKSEINRYDIIILTETHLKEGEEEDFECSLDKEVYFFTHAIEKNSEKRKAGVTIMVKEKLINRDREKIKVEVDPKEGRWVNVGIEGVMKNNLEVWGIYAPNNAVE